MPQSIYDNGGMMGATLDFTDTNRYLVDDTIIDPVFLGATTIGSTTSGDGIVPIPNAENLLPGDLVLAFTISDAGSSFGVDQVPPGYTEGRVVINSATQLNSLWSYKFMGENPDSVVNFPTSNYSEAHAVAVFRGIRQTGTILIQPASTTTASSGGTITTPSISGTIPANSLILQMGFLDDDNVASSVSPPSGYTLTTATNADAPSSSGGPQFDASGGTMMVAHKITSSSQNGEPAQSFTTSGSDLWNADSVVLSGGPIFGNQKNSGIWSLSAALESAVIPPVSLPSDVIAYIPFSQLLGTTQTPVYTPTGVLEAGMSASGAAKITSGQTIISGSSVSGYAAGNTTADGFIGSSELTNLMSVGSSSPLSIEFWWYNSGVITGSYARLFSLGGYWDNGSGIEAESDNLATTSYRFYEYISGQGTEPEIRISRGAYIVPIGWNHIYMAVDPTGGNSYIGINGSVTSFSNYLSSVQPQEQRFSLGCVDNELDDASRGYFQEVIIRNSIPYTSNFTPSTTPLVAGA